MKTILTILVSAYNLAAVAQVYYLQDFSGNVKVKLAGSSWTTVKPEQKGMSLSKGDSIKIGNSAKARFYSSKNDAFYDIDDKINKGQPDEISEQIKALNPDSEHLFSYVWNCIVNEFSHKDKDFTKNYRDAFQATGVVSRGEPCITYPVSGNVLYADSQQFSWKHKKRNGRFIFEIYDDRALSHKVFGALTNDNSYVLGTNDNIKRGQTYWWIFKEEKNGNQCETGYFRILTKDEQLKVMAAHDELKKNYRLNTAINLAIEAKFFEEFALNQNAKECYEQSLRLSQSNEAITSMYNAFTDSLRAK